jgi:capsule synthesis protein PGA_cap
MNEARMVLWQSPDADSQPIAARIAVAGDFLPAGDLNCNGAAWSDLAAPIAAAFADVDATFVNLECPLDAHELQPRTLNGIGDIVTAPSSALEYLEVLRTFAVGLANNHACDFREDGVARTRKAVASRRIAALGGGRSLQSPPETFVWQGPGDVRVGFWAAAKAAHEFATRSAAGVEPATLERAAAAVDQLRKQDATFCVALLHAGCLRTNRPDPEDVVLLDQIARSGFDIVAACHSHRISGCKRVQRGQASAAHCFYGLGTLVSGYASTPEEREGLVVVAALNSSGALASLEVRTVWIAESGFGEAPRREIASAILRRFDSLSGELSDDSFAPLFYRDMADGLLQLHLRDVRAAFRQNGFRGLARKASRLRMRHVRRFVRKVTG